MTRRSIGRAVRTLRLHRRWRQCDLAIAAGISQPMVSRIEHDAVDDMTVATLRSCVGALDGYLALEVRWHGEAVEDLVDAAHARVQDWVARRLATWGWQARLEVSFNHFGDRGRIDLLAFHPGTRNLVVIEVKSRITDAQDTIGRLDVKARLARQLASELGWSASATVPALIVADDRTSRRRVAQHPGLFGCYDLRGRQAMAWIRKPRGQPPSGLLVFVRVPAIRGVNANPRQTGTRMPPHSSGE